jgi:putative ABC transport system ATP-binding protein
MTEPIIELHRVSRRYRSGEGVVEALRELSMVVEPGEFVAIVGPSGSGKSTLLGLISGIDRPSGGEVIVAGQRIDQLSEDALARWRRNNLGIVFQFFQLLPTLTALENVILPMSLRGVSNSARAHALLEEVGLAARTGHLPSALSGGEQQRVAIARALANDPPLLLADEPTGNLDEHTGQEIMSLLANLPRQGKTLVLVTHDRALAARASRIIHMADGQIVREERPEPHQPIPLVP